MKMSAKKVSHKSVSKSKKIIYIYVSCVSKPRKKLKNEKLQHRNLVVMRKIKPTVITFLSAHPHLDLKFMTTDIGKITKRYTGATIRDKAVG